MDMYDRAEKLSNEFGANLLTLMREAKTQEDLDAIEDGFSDGLFVHEAEAREIQRKFEVANDG